MANYLDFIKERIKECFRCLKPSGNIVIHIEPKISHYFRFICDEIFGLNNFENEIVWQTGGNAKNLYQLNRFHDTIIVYSKKGKGKSIFNPIYFPYDAEYRQRNNEIKSSTIDGRLVKGNMSLMNNTMNIKEGDRNNRLLNSRAPAPAIYNQSPGLDTMGRLQGKQQLNSSIQSDRTTPDLHNQLKGNPYALSITK